MLRLPPLGAIEAFVVVARLGSIKTAADALALSPSALSRRVQTLESRVGEALFERKHPSLVLTGEGERLRDAVAPIIRQEEPRVGQEWVCTCRTGRSGRH